MSLCLECEDATAQCRDYRVPPLEEGLCLCPDCAAASIEERREELENEIELLDAELEDLPE